MGMGDGGLGGDRVLIVSTMTWEWDVKEGKYSQSGAKVDDVEL